MSRLLRTRWRCVGRRMRWRAGWLRGEWWIGARHDFLAEALMIGFFGLVVLIVWDGPKTLPPDPSAGQP